MVLPRGLGDLYHKYRPHRFDELSGHSEIVKSLKKAISSSAPSQSFLLLGESGTGKTSTARVMALSLNCENLGDDLEPCLECRACKLIAKGDCIDVIEKNSADHRGIDSVRELSNTMALMPMQVKNKVYILDEFHQMTKEAQTSLLKVLEEASKRTFIILCTTNAEKILPTVKNRCQIFRFKSLSTKEIVSLLEEVCVYEGKAFDPDILTSIAEYSRGSPRSALVKLQQIIQLSDGDGIDRSAVAKFLEAEDVGGNELFKLFSSFKRGTVWSNVVSAYSDVKDMGAPAVGMCLAGYFRNKLIGAKAYDEATFWSSLLELFVIPFDDSKVGENNLVLNMFKSVVICNTPTAAKQAYVSKRY